MTSRRSQRHDLTRVFFTVTARLKHGESLHVVGSVPALGSNLEEDALALATTPKTYPVWVNPKPIAVARGVRVTFRFAVFSGGRFKRWDLVEEPRSFTAEDDSLRVSVTLDQPTMRIVTPHGSQLTRLGSSRRSGMTSSVSGSVSTGHRRQRSRGGESVTSGGDASSTAAASAAPISEAPPPHAHHGAPLSAGASEGAASRSRSRSHSPRSAEAGMQQARSSSEEQRQQVADTLMVQLGGAGAGGSTQSGSSNDG
eukprot:CAMPEP_0196772560 /NCGR_PEP_ID=MMETSP1104-20130614/2297_1 /TAXON_ID=33652 /ORGANISM="Cafeteria sp., Strain Caron Lab Isolate" /LENGTH=254 /DNA_ID=CAMNT_0042142699 /DNA_START=15 /DNA_END=776 /DNA_ORIENTATION=-